jgi:hypothetical protein
MVMPLLISFITAVIGLEAGNQLAADSIFAAMQEEH